jgi:hypothetical protein
MARANHQYSDLQFEEPKRGLWFALRDSVMHSFLGSPPDSRARRPESKAQLEFRQGALFAFGRSVVANDTSVRFAMVPKQADSVDTVLRSGAEEDRFTYESVQLKEIVPDTVNERQTLEILLESLSRRYGTGEKLTIAIHLNRDIVTVLGEVIAPHLPSISFWLFGVCGRKRGFIVRNPFQQFEVTEFDMPRAPASMTQW